MLGIRRCTAEILGREHVAPPRHFQRTCTMLGRQCSYHFGNSRNGGKRHSQKFVLLRWGFPPGRPKGPPVINMRSEGRRFPNGRCLVPASHFYEFTGKRSPKDKWRFTKVGEEWFCIAGIWRPVKEGAAAFTMLTCAPGPDVAPIHNRQVVVLDRSQWADWLQPTSPEKELLRPARRGL